MAVTHDVIRFEDPKVKAMSCDVKKNVRRLPNLGPTRENTEIKSRETTRTKPGTAGLATRRSHNRYRSPDFHVRQLSSNGRLHHSESFASRPKSCFVRRDLRPPHHQAYLFKENTRTDNLKTTSDESKQTAESSSSSVARSKNRTPSLAYRGPSEHFENPPRYCVISSAGTGKSRDSASLSAPRHRKEILNQRASNSYVITADTASLLVQSKSAPIFRSVSDVGTRPKPNLAIREVPNANKDKNTALGNVNNVSCSNINISAEEVVKSKSAHARTSRPTVIKDSGSKSQSHLKTNQYCSFVNLSSSAETDAHQVPNDRSSLENQTRKEVFNTEDVSENDSNLSCTFITLQTVASDDLLVLPRYKCKVDDSNPHYFLMSNTSGLPLIYSNALTNNSSHGSSTINNNKWISGHGAPTKLKSKTGGTSKSQGKTLTPSKHGYHPRSHSPTFKRLLAAAERLEETYNREGSILSPTVSKNNTQEPTSDASSSDASLHRLRYYRDYLNGFDSSDYLSDGNTIKKIPVRKTSVRDTSEVRQSRKKSINDRTKFSKASADDKPPRCPKERTSPERPAVHKEVVCEDKTYCHLTPTNDENLLEQEQLLAFNGAFNSEPERRITNGQPTQLHFFLPQLADNMSEASGGTLTSRSYYQEQRLELLGRNELLQDSVSEDNKAMLISNYSRGREGKAYTTTTTGCSYTDNGKYPSSDKFGKYVVAGTKHQQNNNNNNNNNKTSQSGGTINGFYGERGAGQREPRNSSLSPSRDDPNRHRRYVSPLRSRNPSMDKPVRRKPQSNYKLVPYENMYLESQLPSEKLKKQIDNFPTLVSMEYSGNTTPSQSR